MLFVAFFIHFFNFDVTVNFFSHIAFVYVQPPTFGRFVINYCMWYKYILMYFQLCCFYGEETNYYVFYFCLIICVLKILCRIFMQIQKWKFYTRYRCSFYQIYRPLPKEFYHSVLMYLTWQVMCFNCKKLIPIFLGKKLYYGIFMKSN